ncbi:hypothetical protein [Fretibacter rubidus]|uniref:hypothetical protein n=1 Tax=Fretibacter rubidus TaxID=570162 RepID=UPI00352A0346
MIVKTLFLGLLSAATAGSVMYFGTLPDDGSNDGANNPTSTNASQLSNTSAPETVATDRATNTLRVTSSNDDTSATDDDTVKRLPSLRDTITDKRVERGPEVREQDEAATKIAETDAEPPKKRWLDQYLRNRDKPASDTQPEPQTPQTPQVIAKPETPPKAVADKAVEPADMLNDIIGASDQTRSDTPRYFKIEDGILVEVKPAEVERAQGVPQYDKYPRGAASDDRVLAVAFEEAGRISKPELRDQAYFGILEYALRQDNFVEAEKALAEISQVDMNYTAKSRIAVAFAQKGLSGMAFKTINTVDEPELRDFMRLQVIEAMIAPERLPSAWQEDPRQN